LRFPLHYWALTRQTLAVTLCSVSLARPVFSLAGPLFSLAGGLGCPSSSNSTTRFIET
jgi:hypothetical protein